MEAWIAVGQWITNEVHVFNMSSKRAPLILTQTAQPRSLLYGILGQSDWLFVGRADGTVACYMLQV